MTNRHQVSLTDIDQLLCLLIEGMSNQPKEIFGLNMINESSVVTVVEKFLLPEYQAESYQFQKRFKESLKYAINFASEQALKNQIAGEC